MLKLRRRIAAVIVSLAMLLPIFCTLLAACSETDPPPAEEVTLASIELDTSGAKVNFAFGEEFTAEGLKVTAVMSDGTRQDVALSSCKISTPVMTMPGTRRVNVTYQGKSEGYNITIAEREMPQISKTPLFAIAAGTGTYSVEAESIDLTVSGVKAAEGKQLTGQATDPLAPETKIGYLGNYGVAGNYFGFTFTADKAYENVIIGFHVANPSTTENFGLGERMKVYLNYKGVQDTGDISVDGIPTLEPVSVSYGADDENHEHPILGDMSWWYRVLRGVSIPAGTNTLTFDVTESGEVLYIDRIDICVDGNYEHISSITLDDSKGNDPFIQDFEDFDLENVVTREEFFNTNHMKKGQVWLENCVTDASGRNTSLAAIVAPSEFTTRINLAEDATIEPMMIAASIDAHIHLKDACEFYLDGKLLEDVEDKDIQDGTPRPDGQAGYWNWKDTSLGLLDLKAGAHEFRIVVKGGVGNIDAMKYYVRKWGGFEAELTSITVKTQPATRTYEAGQLFDPEGLVLEAHFADNTTQEVTSGYTWEPSGKLTVEDDTVTVTYRGKTAEIEITVNEPAEDPYDVKIDKNGEFTVEAEDLDMTGNQYQQGKDSFKETTALASGGACLAAFGVAGNKVKVTFRLEQKATVAIQAMMAKYEDTFDFTNNVNFKLDETLLANPGQVSFGRGENNNDYYNWKPVDLGSHTLEAGYHTLTLEIVGGCPNTDYFKFTVSDYGTAEPAPATTADATVDKNGEIVIEAEDLDTSELILRPDFAAAERGFVESPNNGPETSGGQSICGFTAGSKLTVTIRLEAAATVKIVGRLSTGDSNAYDMNANDTITFNGQKIDFTDISLPKDESTYWNWIDVSFGTYELEAGEYTLVIEHTGINLNIDCFKLTVSGYGE